MPDNVYCFMDGHISNQLFNSANVNVLNSGHPDDIAYIFTTLDWDIHAKYGKENFPVVKLFTQMRFQFAWGSFAESQINGKSIVLDEITIPITPTRLNRHLLWLREGWLQCALAQDPEKNNHFIQMGLIPYSIGRGIALGPAYETIGFLGFTPTYNIEQYAPGIVLSINPIKHNVINFYCAMLESFQDNLDTIFEKVHNQEIGACAERGVGHNSFIVALNSKISLFDAKDHESIIEPFIIHITAPDKTLEVARDIDTFLTTFGVSVEANFGKFNWGFECAKNIGNVILNPIDRNKINIIKQDSGIIAERYTKVYTQDPHTPGATLADVTEANQLILDQSPKMASENGKQIGPDLWNAYDRFRPQQNINLTGYYFIADIAYDYIPKILAGALGFGYFSGSDRQEVDINELSPHRCMNQAFNGFVPLQSNYSGTRLRHFVMLNQGIPRYTLATPVEDLSLINRSSTITVDTLNATTNLIFVGTRLKLTPQTFAKNKVLFAPTMIAYWAADTSYVGRENLPENSPFLKELDNYLGTEINMEFSFEFMKDLRFVGYAGVLFPGTYYKQIAGTIVRAFNEPIGADTVFISNFAISYDF